MTVSGTDDSEHHSTIECKTECGIYATDLETISAEEVDDDYNKLRVVSGFLLSDTLAADIKQPIGHCSVVCSNFILFESDNSPPVC